MALPPLKLPTREDFCDLFATKFGQLLGLDLSPEFTLPLSGRQYTPRVPIPPTQTEAQFFSELEDTCVSTIHDLKEYATEQLMALTPRYFQLDTRLLDVLKEQILETTSDLHDKIKIDASQPNMESVEENLEMALKATCKELFNQPDLLMLGRGRQ